MRTNVETLQSHCISPEERDENTRQTSCIQKEQQWEDLCFLSASAEWAAHTIHADDCSGYITAFFRRVYRTFGICTQPGASCLFTVSCGRCLVNVCKAGVRLLFWSEGKTKLLLNRVLNRHKYFSFCEKIERERGRRCSITGACSGSM